MNQSDFPLQILDYWHKLEFFESADIQELSRKQGEGVLHYRLSELNNDAVCLPWLNRQMIRKAGSGYSPEKPYQYSLYLGIFDRSEIFAAATRTFPDWCGVNNERLSEEGLTCSLKFKLNQDGQLDIDSFECSTVTWALGQLQDNRLASIRLEEYEAATKRLQERLLEIVAVASTIKNEHQLPPALTTIEILEFLKAMQAWTTFTPSDVDKHPALLIQLTELDPKKNKHRAPVAQMGQWLSLNQQFPARLQAQADEVLSLSDVKQHAARSPEEITILNSFYLRDIERVHADILANGLTQHSPLGRYLSKSVSYRPDLLTTNGEAVIREKLRINRLPLGRWPSEDTHSMSLMQQFAINTITHDLLNIGLYSVNGPPGTGKTTMLRDLVAHNVVSRAAVLANLAEPASAFGADLTLNLSGDIKTIKTLIPDLTGFEMVVASNNNAAVENISKELPQLKSLGQDYRHVAYLRPVAQKLAARHVYPQDKQDYVEALPAGEDCWGLIAATLGKSKNRNRFGNQILFKTIDNLIAQEEARHYRTLVPALKQLKTSRYPQQDFARAQTAYHVAKKRVEDIQDELSSLQALRDLHSECDSQQECIHNIKLRLARLDARLASCVDRLPTWWSGRFKHWCRRKAIIRGLGQRQDLFTKKLAVEQMKLITLQRQLTAQQLKCVPLVTRYPDIYFIDHQTNFEETNVQRKAPGQCKKLNQARAQLTISALELHQVWLVAAYDQKLLQNSIYHLMDAINGKIADKTVAKALWQLLFMIVPLISSTFASVARQFSSLDSGDIGWLFIDEAGQASPQQAVGALWRARRAVVVGDPLQIEPVFTIPPAFVEAMAKQKLGDQWQKWAPGMTSIQLLADKSNPYGTRQINQNFWLGSPLRVHRRCDEPMFSVANQIAYNNKMIHGSDNPYDTTDFVWGPSCWFDVRGDVEGEHFVPEQARHVLNMLEEYLQQHRILPDVYIITPFKRIKKELQEYLRDALLSSARYDGKQSGQLQKWIAHRIGTVHTFQGKEEKTVILVLGLSKEHPGAAIWASSKPNLLNVAITRAQKRLYIVGCSETWGSRPFFSNAHEALHTIPSKKQPMQVALSLPLPESPPVMTM
ncbi:DEAD/DEAH box helicase [Aeromonas caviae]|uniref:DEAD/DEAH box helicase n=1 Tax=Aeromonas caviae TaxID=648 RepID=UPI001BCD0650|nr:DEAD/DEAH box helicase [Aeromonas caviae]MBS4713411.1 DNA2/NAM7 family helicase [Aeromonas caviae]